MSVVYKLDNTLYLNVTNRCPNNCIFCVRKFRDTLGGKDLWLEEEPDAEELLCAIGDPEQYDELVFCGYGEPILRLELIKEVTSRLKAEYRTPPIRLNTNGLGNLIHDRNIVPELEGLIDVVSISLNAESAGKYVELCRPHFDSGAYEAVLDFAAKCREHIPRVILTVVDLPEVDIEECRAIARDLEVGFRVRTSAPG